jgi:hypothetical protein
MGALSDHSGLENCIEERRADVFVDQSWDLVLEEVGKVNMGWVVKRGYGSARVGVLRAASTAAIVALLLSPSICIASNG